MNETVSPQLLAWAKAHPGKYVHFIVERDEKGEPTITGSIIYKPNANSNE